MSRDAPRPVLAGRLPEPACKGNPAALEDLLERIGGKVAENFGKKILTPEAQGKTWALSFNLLVHVASRLWWKRRLFTRDGQPIGLYDGIGMRNDTEDWPIEGGRARIPNPGRLGSYRLFTTSPTAGGVVPL